MNKGHVQKVGLVIFGVVIGVLLGTGAGLTNRADAQPAARTPAASPFEGVEILRFGDHGFLLFDRTSGKFWRYDVRAEKGFPYQRFGGGWQIEQPGAEPHPIK